MRKRLRYRDLKARGIVNNRPTLSNWIRNEGFPPRTVDRAELEDLGRGRRGRLAC